MTRPSRFLRFIAWLLMPWARCQGLEAENRWWQRESETWKALYEQQCKANDRHYADLSNEYRRFDKVYERAKALKDERRIKTPRLP